jgi:protein-tyrosine phosphatase
MNDERWAILAVCHANLCRSPLIERLIRRALIDALGSQSAAAFTVSSVGTHAHGGSPMHPYAAAVLRERGADEVGFQSRSIAAGAIAQADLILTADRPQRSLCVSAAPSAIARTFTLRQFGRLAAVVDPASLPDGPPVTRARALVVEAHLARALFQPVAPEEDDLADPVGGPIEAFRECARQIHEPIDVMVSLLVPR